MTANQSPSQIDVTPEINGWKMPDRIWLMDLGCGDVTWCEDPDPDGEQVDSVEYVRADLVLSRTIPPTEEQEVERVGDGEQFGFPLTKEKIEEFRRLHGLARADIAEEHIRVMARMWGCSPGFAHHHIMQDHREQEARAALSTNREVIAGLREWALNKSSEHHRLAAEDEHLRTEHIASSSAYRSLAAEIDALLKEQQP